MSKKPFTTFEIAKYCHVTHRAVLKWVSAGKLKSYKTPGGHNRVHQEDFVEFLKEYDMPIPEELGALLRKKKRILIVDDDRTIVSLIRKLISDHGDYEIEEAYAGKPPSTPGLIVQSI